MSFSTPGPSPRRRLASAAGASVRLLVAGAALLAGGAPAEARVAADMPGRLAADQPLLVLVAQQGRDAVLREPIIMQGRFAGDFPPGFAMPSEGSLPNDARLSEVRIAPEIIDLAARLEHDDWLTREQAAKTLIEMPFVDEQLAALLWRGTLETEAHNRLLNALCERLATLPRGAIGIRMELADGAAGAVIQSLIDDMPAKQSGLLRPGDRIVAIDGRPVTRTRTTFSIIQLERPGQTVRLTIERPKQAAAGGPAVGLAPDPRRPMDTAPPERLEIDLVLGSTDQLDRIEVQGWGGGSRFFQMRAEQVREARERFRPRSVEIPVSRHVAVDPTPIDEHPEVRELLLMRERVDAGTLTVTASMRAAWLATLARLEEQARDPANSESIREFHRRVARRYAEVMPR